MLFGIAGCLYGEMKLGCSHTIHKNHFHVGWKGKCETVKLLEDITEYLDDLKVKEKKISWAKHAQGKKSH